MRIAKLLSAALAGAALIVFTAAADAANPRIALVIGESAYPDQTLPTTANDAGLVAQVLQAAGFDVVGARDLDQKGIRQSMSDFLDKANAAGPDMQAFVYFSGRALQFNGENYLAPVDAQIARAADTPIQTIKLSDFTHALASAPGLARVVVIDGARPNPYAQTGDPLAGGLALVDPEPNSVIAFNAAPGAVGVEDTGDYGVYAKTLAGLMRQGGVDIRDVLDQTRVAVNQATQGAQIPWNAGQLSAPYFLFERAADAKPVRRPLRPKRPIRDLPPAEAYQAVIESDRIQDYEEFMRYHRRAEEARRVEAILAARREALFWRRAWTADEPRGYWTYLRFYPDGPHAWDARRRLAALRAEYQPPPDFVVQSYEDLPPPPPAEAVWADRPVYYFGGEDFGPPPPPPPPEYVYDYGDDSWRDLPPPPEPTVAGVLPALAVAIPLMIGARAYFDRPRRDGVAPANAPPPPNKPLAPPPLPQGVTAKNIVRPVAPAPAPTAQPTGPAKVNFVPPAKATPGGRPPAPVTAPKGATLAKPQPAVTPGQPTPATTAKPLPGMTPAKPLPTVTPTHPTPMPTAKPLPGLTPAKPLPTAPSAHPTPMPTAKPLPGLTPAKPLPTPPSAHPTPTTTAKPLPGVAPVKPLPAPPKPAPVKPTTTAPAKTEPKASLEPSRLAPKPVAPAHVAPKPIEPAHIAPKPVAPKPVAPRPVEPPHVAPRPVTPVHVAPKPVEPPHVAPRPVAPVHVAPRPVEPPRVAPRPVEPVHVAPRPVAPPHPAPAAKPACGHPGQPKC